MDLLSLDTFFSWDDLSSDNGAKEKRYRFQKSGKNRILVPTKILLNVKWNISSGTGNFQIFAANGFPSSDQTVTTALTGVDYSDGSEKTFPLTLQADTGSGQKDLLIGPSVTSEWGKCPFSGIYLMISPAATQNGGWIKGFVTLLSD